MIFGRNRDVKIEHVTLPEHLRDDQDDNLDPEKQFGPWDITEKEPEEPFLDLGVLKLPIDPEVKVRLDLEESTRTIVGVTLTHENSSLQIQAFAAPRSGGLWDEIRAELTESLEKQNSATVTEEEGEFGTELLAKVPAKLPDGRPGLRVARFIGVDGHRWFLRAVVGGEAVLQAIKATKLFDAFKNVVVDRDNKPQPARNLMRLTPPKNARPVAPGQQEGTVNDQGMPARGPEITEIR